MTSITPAQFGALHRQLFETVVGREAAKIGATKITDDLVLAFALSGGDKDLKLTYPFLSAISNEQGHKHLPLGAAYALDEKHATDVAIQAAKATMGAITPESAKFLPDDYRACYERLTGQKVAPGTGIAVKGVTITGSDDKPDVTIEFKKALDGITADQAILAVTKAFEIAAIRTDRPEDPSLPPYYICIRDADSNPAQRSIHSKNGTSSFESNHIVSAGDDHLEVTEGSDTNVVASMTFHLDETNDISSWKLPSPATEAMRAVWGATLKGSSFDLTSAIASGSVEAKTRDEVEAYRGSKALFSFIRRSTSESITNLLKHGDLAFAYDAKTLTCAARLVLEGRECLLVLNTKSHEMAGFFVSIPGKPVLWREA